MFKIYGHFGIKKISRQDLEIILKLRHLILVNAHENLWSFWHREDSRHGEGMVFIGINLRLMSLRH